MKIGKAQSAALKMVEQWKDANKIKNIYDRQNVKNYPFSQKPKEGIQPKLLNLINAATNNNNDLAVRYVKASI